MNDPLPIDANITIRSTYNDMIWIEIQDKTSGIRFVRVELTREQFVNATMNQLCNTDVIKTEVRDLDKVGKTMEQKKLEFPLPDWAQICDKGVARNEAAARCPEGWEPDTGFGCQDSFFRNEDGVEYARTTIRRWV